MEKFRNLIQSNLLENKQKDFADYMAGKIKNPEDINAPKDEIAKISDIEMFIKNNFMQNMMATEYGTTKEIVKKQAQKLLKYLKKEK